jgi:DNA-binding transcriptional LysR family regulator
MRTCHGQHSMEAGPPCAANCPTSSADCWSSQASLSLPLPDQHPSLASRATLDDMPDSELDRLAHACFDWIWFLGAWQTGQAGDELPGRVVRAQDLMSSVAYERDGDELFFITAFTSTCRSGVITFLHWRRSETGTDRKRTSRERTGEQP